MAIGITGGELLGRLTARERSVLGLVLTGSPAWAIAGYLGMARPTVRNHLHKLYKALGVPGMQQLFVLAIDAGLVERNHVGPGTRATFPYEVRKFRSPGGQPTHRRAA